MTPSETVVALTKHIRDKVRPHLGAWHARQVTGTAESGDATFAIDDIAEEAIVEFIEKHKLSVAFYSEDKGLIEFGDPEAVLVIDPNRRHAACARSFEQSVVAVSWADYTADVTMGDVRYACVAELKRNDIFFAERGKGAKWTAHDGSVRGPNLLPIDEIAKAPITFEIVARPFEYLGTVLDDIVNTSSMKGGTFVFSSTAYSLTRLMSGQLAGVLDVGHRILHDFPQTREKFLRIGKGTAIGLFTYDIAAAALIASEAGAIVSDAYGNDFRETKMLDTSESNLQSMCAASTPILHERLLEAIDAGMVSLHARLSEAND